VLGLLDDLLIVPLGVVLVRRLAPADVMAGCRAEAEAAFAGGGPVSRAGAVLIAAAWCGLAYLACRAVRGLW
jgi:uncharacterized membrane protein YkvA (DUF1232 family)